MNILIKIDIEFIHVYNRIELAMPQQYVFFSHNRMFPCFIPVAYPS